MYIIITYIPESDIVSLLDINEKLEIKVDSAGNLNVGKDASVCMVLGTYPWYTCIFVCHGICLYV